MLLLLSQTSLVNNAVYTGLYSSGRMAETSTPGKPGARKSSSWVWRYFNLDKVEKTSTCTICLKVFKAHADGTTTNYAKHLREKHSDLIEPAFMQKGPPKKKKDGEGTSGRTSKKVFSYNVLLCMSILMA